MEVFNDAKATRKTKRYFFTGATALKQGMGLCFDVATGTAATADEGKLRKVAVPTSANALFFVGVATTDYKAHTGGQWVYLDCPGGVAEIAAGVNTTDRSTILTCSCSAADAGRFTQFGFVGRGTALALQTKTNLVGTLLTGVGSLDATGKILTGTGDTFVTKGAVAGDKVVILANAADTAVTLTPGEYVIASVDSETQVTLTTAAATGACNVAYYAIHGNPLVLAYLFDGEESGLQQWVSSQDSVASDCNESGWTRICGGATLTTGVATGVLADGTRVGQKKGFLGMGTLTTHGYTATITTGTQVGVVTALASLTFDAAAECAVLEWMGQRWMCIHTVGATVA